MNVSFVFFWQLMYDARMTPEQIIDVSRISIETLLVISTPLMAVALGVGLIVALFQALTSMQEMTLTFVPKIFAVFLVLIWVLPWMSDTLHAMSMELFSKIASGGNA